MPKLKAADGPAPDTPPVAKIVPKPMTVHGDTRVDNYFWLREKTNPEVIQYLEAENRFTESMMKATEPLQAKLYKEMLRRIKETDLSLPTKSDDYYYYTRTVKGQQYPLYCRKHRTLRAAEELILDANALAKGQKYFRMGVYVVSPNHRLLAYSTDTKGDEMYTIHVKDLKTGRLLKDRIPNTYYSFAWANDNKTFYYTTLDPAQRPDKLFRHVLGTAAVEDVLVHHETDEKFNVSIRKTKDKRFLILDLSSLATSENLYLSADDPAGGFRVIEPRRFDIQYDVEHHGDSFYIVVNDTGRNFRLVKAPDTEPGKENWQEIIAHRADETIERLDPFEKHFVLFVREKGLRKIRVRDLSTGKEHGIEFPEPAFATFPAANPEFKSNVVRFVYTSLVTPPAVYDYNMDTRKRTLKKRTPVLGGYDTSKYKTEWLFATAKDGTKVPISLVYKKGFRRTGRAPLFLYGYGSYGAPMEPGFVSDRLSLLDRGFVYAIAHIRGGSEMGKTWHDAGKLLSKTNTFTDFIACAEHLVAEKYSSPDRMVMEGASAGGLLMGAVVNLRPDLFKAVLAKVPFVDVLNTALDATLPLTVGEYDEWGNSNEKQFYDYIKSYAPYENVKPQAYPNMLVTAGLNDPRVSYWEPAKWVAKLRTVKTGQNLLLLKTNMGGGHFGKSGRYERLHETAFEYAFVLKVLGLEK